MRSKLPGVGFFVATFFAAWGIVGGAGGIVVEYRNHTHDFMGFAGMFAMGTALLTFAFLAQERGKNQRVLARLRNSASALFVLFMILALFLLLVGPLH